MTYESRQRPYPVPRIVISGLLGWILPGAGHLFLGEKGRGLVFLVVIGVTFWSGIAVGAVRYTVDPHERTAWFMAQLCTGTHALAAYGWSGAVRSSGQAPEASPSYRGSETGIVYTGVAGLLNVLVIIDALVRSDGGMISIVSRGPRKREGPS